MLKNQWSKKEIEDSEYEIHHRALSEELLLLKMTKLQKDPVFLDQ